MPRWIWCGGDYSEAHHSNAKENMKKFVVSKSLRNSSVILSFIIILLSGLCSCTKQKSDGQALKVDETSPTLTPQVAQSVRPQRTPYPPNSTYKYKNGYVPNEATAIRIAEAVIVPAFGENCVKSEQPFTAVLVNGTRIVEGTLSHAVGGTAYVEISKETGCVLNLTHGK